MEAEQPRFKKLAKRCENSFNSHINNLDDGCLMLIFSFLCPIPGINFFCLENCSSLFSQNSWFLIVSSLNSFSEYLALLGIGQFGLLYGNWWKNWSWCGVNVDKYVPFVYNSWIGVKLEFNFGVIVKSLFFFLIWWNFFGVIVRSLPFFGAILCG